MPAAVRAASPEGQLPARDVFTIELRGRGTSDYTSGVLVALLGETAACLCRVDARELERGARGMRLALQLAATGSEQDIAASTGTGSLGELRAVWLAAERGDFDITEVVVTAPVEQADAAAGASYVFRGAFPLREGECAQLKLSEQAAEGQQAAATKWRVRTAQELEDARRETMLQYAGLKQRMLTTMIGLVTVGSGAVYALVLALGTQADAGDAARDAASFAGGGLLGLLGLLGLQKRVDDIAPERPGGATDEDEDEDEDEEGKLSRFGTSLDPAMVATLFVATVALARFASQGGPSGTFHRATPRVVAEKTQTDAGHTGARPNFEC